MYERNVKPLHKKVGTVDLRLEGRHTMKAGLSLLHGHCPAHAPSHFKVSMQTKFTIDSSVMFNGLYICTRGDWGAAMLRGKEVLYWLAHDAFLGKWAAEERRVLEGI